MGCVQSMVMHTVSVKFWMLWGHYRLCISGTERYL